MTRLIDSLDLRKPEAVEAAEAAAFWDWQPGFPDFSPRLQRFIDGERWQRRSLWEADYRITWTVLPPPSGFKVVAIHLWLLVRRLPRWRAR